MPLKRRITKPDLSPAWPRPGEDIWTSLCRAIEDDKFVPIISNCVCNDAIFGEEAEAVEVQESSPYAIQEELAIEWARRLIYPLVEKHRLPGVAQFNQVITENIPLAKTAYLDFIKEMLLEIAEADEKVAELVPGLRAQVMKLNFTELAHDHLGYPYYDQAEADPLRLLARLPLPLYVTTGYHTILEKLILEEGRQAVHSHVCPWSGSLPEQYLPAPDFKPSREAPVVYHLFGLEQEETSLVLSEDDHLDFLVKVFHDLSATTATQADGTNIGLIPLYLRNALKESALMLLGYRLQDWDFRVLFRGVLNAGEAPLRRLSLAIQLDLARQKGIDNEAAARQYLEKYFKPPFQVAWETTLAAVTKLTEAWQKWQR
jgi:hypothetical protein